MADPRASSRPTRWQKARADTKFFRWKREAAIGAAAAPLSFVLLQLIGSKDGATDELVVVGASVVVVLVMLPLTELAYNWLQAPIRMLSDDVLAIRHDLSGRYSAEQRAAREAAQRQERAVVRRAALEASENVRLVCETLERCLTEPTHVQVLATHPHVTDANMWKANLDGLLRSGEMLTAYRALLRLQRSYNTLVQFANERRMAARQASFQPIPPGGSPPAPPRYDDEPLVTQIREAHDDAIAAGDALEQALTALGRDDGHE